VAAGIWDRCVGGVGFTMSLFIRTVAYPNC
jgi:Na+/H+ antiporter NhaA